MSFTAKGTGTVSELLPGYFYTKLSFETRMTFSKNRWILQDIYAYFCQAQVYLSYLATEAKLLSHPGSVSIYFLVFDQTSKRVSSGQVLRSSMQDTRSYPSSGTDATVA